MCSEVLFPLPALGPRLILRSPGRAGSSPLFSGLFCQRESAFPIPLGKTSQKETDEYGEQEADMKFCAFTAALRLLGGSFLEAGERIKAPKPVESTGPTDADDGTIPVPNPGQNGSHKVSPEMPCVSVMERRKLCQRDVGMHVRAKLNDASPLRGDEGTKHNPGQIQGSLCAPEQLRTRRR